MRPSAVRLLTRQRAPFAVPPAAPLRQAQAKRLDMLARHPWRAPRVSDPPLPPVPYPSALNAPLRPGRKPQRRPWLGPDDSEVVQPAVVWAVNPDHPRAKEAEGRVPDAWFVRRVDHSDFLPVYTDRRQGSILTVIRKIEGDSQALLDPLLKYLSSLTSNPKLTAQGAVGRVVRTTGDIEVRGNWRAEVRQFLVSKGM